MKQILLVLLSFFIFGTASATLPYRIDFSETTQGWSVADRNADGVTWISGTDFFGNSGMYYVNSCLVDADDWLISPSFELERGKRYAVIFETKDLFPGHNDRLILWQGSSPDPGSFKNMLAERIPLGEVRDSVVFEPETTGSYRFAIQNCSASMNGEIVITTFSVEQLSNTPEEHLFSFDVSSLKGWTVIDANSDGNTWESKPGISGITSGMSSVQGDDWLITEAFEAKSGKAYQLTYSLELTAQGFESELMDVYVGNEPTVAGMTKLVEAVEFDGNIRRVVKIVADKTGDWYVGFHKHSPANGGNVSLTGAFIDEFRVSAPLAVTDLVAEVVKSASKVELTWTNPTLNVDRMPLTDELILKVYRNQVLVRTLKGEAGASMRCEELPSPFSGEAIYKIVPYNLDAEGEAAEITVNLDNADGPLARMDDYDWDTDEGRNRWTIIDGNQDGKMWNIKNRGAGTDRFARLEWGSKMDDWLIAPALGMKVNKRYVVRFEVKTSLNFPSSLEVMLIPGDDPAQGKLIQSFAGLETNGYVPKQTEQFEVEASGDFRLAFHCTDNQNGIEIKHIQLLYVDEPSGSHFRTFDVSGLSGWTVIDANADGNGWTKNDADETVSCNSAAGYPNDDWLITEGIVVGKGKAYELTYVLDALHTSGQQKKLEIYSATSPTVDGTKALLRTEEFATGLKKSVRFACETSETVYLAFRDCSPAGSGKTELLKAYLDERPIVPPAGVTDLKARSDKEAGMVTVSWVNPALNSDGGELKEDLTLRFYRDDNLIRTLQGAPGVGMSVEDAPTPYSGTCVYKVIPGVSGSDGEAGSVTVDLGESSEDEHVCTFPVNRLNEWVVVDANSDGNTWKTVDGTNGITYLSSEVPADDWLLTKGVDVEKGKVYMLTFSLSVTNGNADPEKLEIYSGTSGTVPGMSMLLKTEEFREGIRDSVKWMAETPGTLYFGFRMASPGRGGNVSLTEAFVDTVTVYAPEPVLNLQVTQDKLISKVTLSWMNPSLDSKGDRIADDLMISVYRNDALLKTMAGSPGERMTWEDSPLPYSGDYLYKVVSSIFGRTDGEAGVSVNLDHLYYFDTDKLNEWTIIDDNRDNHTWKSVPGTAGITYKTGEKAADDWLITKSFYVEGYKPYLLDYTFESQPDAKADQIVDVLIGTTPDTGMEFPVRTEKFTGHLQRSMRFVPNVSGVYYLGFRVTSPASAGDLSLTALSIDRLPDVESLPVTDLGYTLNFENSKVVLSWTNPVADVDGNALEQGDLYIQVYCDDAVVMASQATPGSEMDYEDTIIPFEGTYKYKIVPYVLNFPGQQAEITVEIIKNGIKTAASRTVRYIPSISSLYIDGAYESVDVVDLSGRMVFRDRSMKPVVDLSSLPNGAYVAKVNVAGRLESVKLIKN